eukprot:m.795959 g.795959  ORF g.795959 m.795959 type:complete len:366 (-) comp23341_c0_seq75:4085-5182(-)
MAAASELHHDPSADDVVAMASMSCDMFIGNDDPVGAANHALQEANTCVVTESFNDAIELFKLAERCIEKGADKLTGQAHMDCVRARLGAALGLGDLLLRLGRYADAFKSYTAAVLAGKQFLRGDGEQVIHRDAHITDAINTAVANVAALRTAQSSHYLNAIAFYQRALDLRVETTGPASRQVAACCTNLGQLHKSAGNLAVALGYFLRALYITLAVAGETHGDSAVAVNNVAELHRHGGDFSASLQYYEWAYEIREAALGDCALTADTAFNVALLYKHLLNFTASEDYFTKSAVVLEKVHGPDHPDVLDAKKQAARSKDLQQSRRLTFTGKNATAPGARGGNPPPRVTTPDAEAAEPSQFEETAI